MTPARSLVPLRWALFALVWFSCAFFTSWEFNANNATRMYATVSLVERGDATIDEFEGTTVDKAMFAGHYYSDKAPGMTLMAIPAVFAATKATGVTSVALNHTIWDPGFSRFLKLRQQIAVAIGPALLTAIAALLLFELGLAATARADAALFGALGFAFGTPVWGWSTTIFGHAPVAALYVVAAWAIWTLPASRHHGWLALLTGASLGWAVAIEFQSVLAGLILAGWAAVRWWRVDARWRWLALASVAGIVMLLPVGAYNMVAFGTPFRVGYSGVVGWEGMQTGLFGLGWPRARVAAEVLVLPRFGLVWVAPIVVLAPIGLALLVDERRTRGLGFAAIGAALATLLVNMAYVYWQGGNTTGPRFLTPALGMLALGFAPFWAELRTRWGRIASGALLALSVAVNAAIASANVMASPVPAIPVWTDVIAGPFAAGSLRTILGDWWGWSPWHAFALWAAIALGATAWMIRRVSRAA